jgi:hypothetical protein
VFSHCVGCPFTFLIIAFEAQKFLILMNNLFKDFCCSCFYFQVQETIAQWQVIEMYYYCFLLRVYGLRGSILSY